MKKRGFSLVEILVALIIISLITAALAPVITKKLSSSGITIAGGGGGDNTPDEPEITIECTDVDPNCLVCKGEECLTCDSDYELNSEGKCESKEPEYVTRRPASQEDCDPYKAHYFQGTCITKGNTGDTSKGGAPIVNVDGIENKTAGSKCTTASCCWTGTTAGTCSTYSNSNYSGCTRTVCTWGAAKIACANYDINDTKGKWRLPTYDELQVWKNVSNNNDVAGAVSTLSKRLGKRGLDLCDSSQYGTSHYGSAVCAHTQKCTAVSGGDGYCRPYRVWGEEDTAANAFHLQLNEQSMSTGTSAKQGYGYSSRCVLEEVYAPEIMPEEEKDMSDYKIPESQSECDPYNAYYFNNTCITKANVGDTANGGPPLGSSTVTTGLFSDYGIQVLAPSSDCTTRTCCWTGSKTAGTCGTFTPTKKAYDGCNRTVCDWWAADIACKNYSINDSKGLWELPSQDDLSAWKNAYTNDLSASIATFSKYLGSNGLDLCDGSQYGTSHYGSGVCAHVQKCIATGKEDGYCRPYDVWGEASDAASNTTTAFIFRINEGSSSVSSGVDKSFAGKSARCVLRKVKKGNEAAAPAADTRRLKTPSSQADCTPFKAFYWNGTCITKANGGDVDRGGAQLDSNNTVVAGNLTDYNIYILSPGGTCTSRHCCWTGGKTAGTCGAYSITGSYDGCNRTVCNWYAAKTICDNYSINNSKGLWELPTLADLNIWKTAIGNDTAANAKFSKFLGLNGLDLCDGSQYGTSHYGSGVCAHTQSCKTNGVSDYGQYCFPYQVWGAAADVSLTSTNAYRFNLDSGSASVSSNIAKIEGGKSVRCLIRKIPY